MLRISVVLLFLIIAGCENTSSLYAPNGGKPPAAAVTKSSQWTASGTIDMPSYAIDGNNYTAAKSSPNYSDALITIDLGKACLFNAIFIDHGNNPKGYCRKVGVLTSLDGKNFTMRHQAPGTRKVTSLCMITPVLARYVRIQAMKKGSQPWSVAEVIIQ